MSRVTPETLERLEAFIDSLPEDSRNKCALCTETLTHIVKTAEVETGAGTATVTRVLSERINETAAPADRVSGKQLQDKVRYHSGVDKIGNSENKPPAETEPEQPVEAVIDYRVKESILRRAKNGELSTREMSALLEQGRELKNKKKSFAGKFIHTDTYPVSDALFFAEAAIAQLESIKKDDPKKDEALNKIIAFSIKALDITDYERVINLVNLLAEIIIRNRSWEMPQNKRWMHIMGCIKDLGSLFWDEKGCPTGKGYIKVDEWLKTAFPKKPEDFEE